jgi:hypothetical protein
MSRSIYLNYRHLLVTALMLNVVSTTKAQNITAAHFRVSDKIQGLRSIELILNSKIIIGLGPEGNIFYVDQVDGSNSGNENDNGPSSDRFYNTEGNPTSIANQAITYFDSSDKDKEGKIQSIGSIKFDYNDSYDIHDIKGRLKSIGNIKIAYNNSFDIHDKAGTLKSIGDIDIKYYNAFDINDPQGKVKSVGKVKVSYYNKFDDQKYFGRIKSITGNSKRLYITK